LTKPLLICKGDSAELRASSSSGVYRWTGPGIIDSSAAVQRLKPSASASYTVTATYADGCKPSLNTRIDLDNSLKLDFSYDYKFYCNSPAQIAINNKSIGGGNYKWDLNGKIQNGTNPGLFVLNQNQNYKIKLSSESTIGCKDELLKDVSFNAYDGLIPNVISPNNDNKNDTWVLGFPRMSVEIFNSWGKAIFKSNDYQNNWGSKASTGSYYYNIKIKDGPVCKGWLSVLN
jgi:gliding motility-associated-like protein